MPVARQIHRPPFLCRQEFRSIVRPYYRSIPSEVHGTFYPRVRQLRCIELGFGVLSFSKYGPLVTSGDDAANDSCCGENDDDDDDDKDDSNVNDCSDYFYDMMSYYLCSITDLATEDCERYTSSPHVSSPHHPTRAAVLLDPATSDPPEHLADQVATCLLDAFPNQLPFLVNLRSLHITIGRQEFALVVDTYDDGADGNVVATTKAIVNGGVNG